MIGFVADSFTAFDLIMEGDGEGLCEAVSHGLIDYAAMVLGEDRINRNLAFMTKVGYDTEADMLEDYYSSDLKLDVTYYRSKIYPTAVSIDAEFRYRYSALQDIKKEEVVSFIDEKNVDTLFVAGALLSFKPVSKEIVDAILTRKDKLSSVIVDASISYKLLLLEELKENLEILVKNGISLFMVGNPVSVDGVKGMSEDRMDEILLSLSEEKAQKGI